MCPIHTICASTYMYIGRSWVLTVHCVQTVRKLITSDIHSVYVSHTLLGWCHRGDFLVTPARKMVIIFKPRYVRTSDSVIHFSIIVVSVTLIVKIRHISDTFLDTKFGSENMSRNTTLFLDACQHGCQVTGPALPHFKRCGMGFGPCLPLAGTLCTSPIYSNCVGS